MTRTALKTSLARKSGTELEAWLLGEPQLDADALTLLAAYRDAAEAARVAAGSVAVESCADSEAAEAPSIPAASRTPPGVPRLQIVAGIDESRLAPLHGGLIADGFLTAELLGRSDGLAYRITREGLRRLAGEIDEAEAA